MCMDDSYKGNLSLPRVLNVLRGIHILPPLQSARLRRATKAGGFRYAQRSVILCGAAAIKQVLCSGWHRCFHLDQAVPCNSFGCWESVAIAAESALVAELSAASSGK